MSATSLHSPAPAARAAAAHSAALRAQMVRDLVQAHLAKGDALRPEVVQALLAVPRELFLPGVELTEAYRDRSVVTERRGAEAVSAVSPPSTMAMMLNQATSALDGLTGRHVLEVGSGGLFAALLREGVGTTGSVTTVDISSRVAERARVCLAAAGYHDVAVICADAAHPITPGRRYDLIVVTAGAWDIPSAWRDQLTDGGVLLVPLRTCGMTRSWALRHAGDGRMRSVSNRLCGFVPVRGDDEHRVRYVDLTDGVHLRLDEHEHLPPAALQGLLERPRHEASGGVPLPARTVLSDLDLWLATRILTERAAGDTSRQFVLLSAQEAAVAAGVVTPSWRFGTPAVLDAATFTYRSALRWHGETFDLAAVSHGPPAAAAAAAWRMVGYMRAWAERGCPAPTLHVVPPQIPDGDLPAGIAMDKRNSRLVLAFDPQEGSR